MKTIKNMSMEALIAEFESSAFRATNYPNNKSINNHFTSVEKELCKRTGANYEKVRELTGQI